MNSITKNAPGVSPETGNVVYIVTSVALDYNDEYYYQTEGENISSSSGYATLEAAQEALKTHFKDNFGTYELQDLNYEGEYYETDGIHPEIYELYWIPYGEPMSKQYIEDLKAQHGTTDYWHQYFGNNFSKWSGFIEWAENTGIEWANYVNIKNYIHIHEVTLT
jgi:hypothetical protein